MKDAFRVYVYVNTKNGKRYVGTTSMDMCARAGKNGIDYRGSRVFFAAIQRHGWGSFRVESCIEGLVRGEAAALEKKLIIDYSTTDADLGYNLQRGGLNLAKLEEGHRRVRSEKIRATLVAQRSSKAVRAEMSDRMRDVWTRPEHREHCLAKRLANPPGRKAIRILCVDTGVVYTNMHEAAKSLGFSVARISRGLKKTGGSAVLGTRKKQGPVVRLHRLEDVDVKRGELLEKA